MVRMVVSLSSRHTPILTCPSSILQACCTHSDDAPHYGPSATHHHELCSRAAVACPDSVVDKSLFMKVEHVHEKPYTLRVFDPRDVVPYLISIFGFLLAVNGRRVVFNPETLFKSMAESRVIILCLDEANMLCGFCFMEPMAVTMHKRRFVEIQTGCGERVQFATSPTACDVSYISAMSAVKGTGQHIVDFARYVADFSPSKTLLLDALDGTHQFYKRCKLVCVGKTEGKHAENGMYTFGGKAYAFDVKAIKDIYNKKPLEYKYPFDAGFNDRLFELLKLSKKNPAEAAAFAGCRALAYVPTVEETLTKEQLFSEDLVLLDEALKKAANSPIKNIAEVEGFKRATLQPFCVKERDVAKTNSGLTIDVAFAEHDEPLDDVDLDAIDMKLGHLDDFVRELVDLPVATPFAGLKEASRKFSDVLADVKNKAREAIEFAERLETRIAAVDEANALMEATMMEHAAAVEATRIAQDKATQLAARVQQVVSNHKRASSEVEEMVAKRQRLY